MSIGALLLSKLLQTAADQKTQCHCMGCQTRKLPFAPESTEALRARLPAALERIYTSADFSPAGNPSAPLTEEIIRRQCFDFASGIRLVLTIESSGRTSLHFDFRLQPESAGRFSEQAFQDAADDIAAAFGATGKPFRLTFTPNGQEYDLYFRHHLPAPDHQQFAA